MGPLSHVTRLDGPSVTLRVVSTSDVARRGLQ